ncbi:hypothetical protein HDZ31DRAFT_33849 [Schizophyllum fasciatum]
MAASAPVAVPEDRASYGIFHDEDRHFTLKLWLKLVYTDDVHRQHRAEELERMKIMCVEHWKHSMGWQHEFLAFTLSYEHDGETFKRYIRIERIGQINEDDDPCTVPANFSDWSSGIKPRSGDSFDHTLDVTAAWGGTKPARDAVTIDPYRYDSKDGGRRWPADAQCLYTLAFPPERPPNVLQLALVIDRVHNIGPRYSLLGAMCYWFARCVYEVLKRRFGGTERRTGSAGQRGTYLGRVFVDDQLRFNISRLTQDVLEKTAKKFRQQTAPGSGPWQGAFRRSKNAPVAGQDGNTTQELMAAMNQERLDLLQANPDLFDSEGQGVGSTAGAPSPSQLVQPVQQLLDSFDDLYEAKIRDVRALVWKYMKDAREEKDRRVRAEQKAQEEAQQRLQAEQRAQSEQQQRLQVEQTLEAERQKWAEERRRLLQGSAARSQEIPAPQHTASKAAQDRAT